MEDESNTISCEPQCTWLFIVGINKQWEEDRDIYGDVGLLEAFLSVGVPSDHIVFCKDDQATAQTILKQLASFLDRTRAGDTFVFYYGGHGLMNAFCTVGGNCKHKQIIHVMEEHFAGSHLVALIDCCNSGSFALEVRDRMKRPRTKSFVYLCLMSTPAEKEAGPEWVLTRCWINAMKGVRSFRKHPRNDSNNSSVITWKDVIANMSDQTAKVKGDLMVVYSTDTIDPDCPFFCKKRSNLLQQDANPTSTLGNDRKHPRQQEEWGIANLKETAEKWPVTTPPPVVQKIEETTRKSTRRPFVVGDAVYYRYMGGVPTLGAPYIMPVWFSASIDAILETAGLLLLTVNDPLHEIQWKVTVLSSPSPNELLTVFDMKSCCYVPESFVLFQCKMAEKRNYIDHSISAATPVLVLWPDEGKRRYRATVADWKAIDWDEAMKSPEMNRYGEGRGPHIPVLWEMDDSFSVVPRSDTEIVYDDDGHPFDKHAAASGAQPKEEDEDFLMIGESSRRRRKSPTLKTTPPDTTTHQHVPKKAAVRDNKSALDADPRQILLKSIRSAGKTLCHSRDLVGTTNIRCFWPIDRRWYKAVGVGLEEASVRDLCNHCCYDDPGDYCLIQWYGYDDAELVPAKFVRPRTPVQEEEEASTAAAAPL